MVKRIGGGRRKTRYKMSKPVRMKGKISLRNMFYSYKDGQKVVINAEPSVQKGLSHRRFIGKIGTVIGKQGKSYKVQINDNKSKKTVIIKAVHLKGA